MKDIFGNELSRGDLVIMQDGNDLSVGIIRGGEYSLQFYIISYKGATVSAGVSLAKKDMKINKSGVLTCYLNRPRSSRIMKIDRSQLDSNHVKVYDEIMSILNNNVATANNT